MSAESLRRYRFATRAQWGACLVAGARRDGAPGEVSLQPRAPWASPPALLASPGGRAPAVTAGGELLWVDDALRLHRLLPGADAPDAVRAPLPLACAARVVPARGALWVVRAPATLVRYEEDTLAELAAVTLDGARVVDLAPAGEGAILALVERAAGGPGGPRWSVERVDPRGRVVRSWALTGVPAPLALVALRRTRTVVVLTGEAPQRLVGLALDTGDVVLDVPVAPGRPSFRGAVLGTDGRALLAVGGVDAGGVPLVALLDDGGDVAGEVAVDPRDGAPTGIAATRDALLVTGAQGLSRYTPAAAVPGELPEVRLTVVTPALVSPVGADDRRWLRIEARADLPEGTTLELSSAASDDPEVRARLAAIAADPALPSGARLRKLLADPGLSWTRTVFHGSDGAAAAAAAPLSAPLFDVRAGHVWACATLIASPGAALPALRALEVLYPGRSLMEDLPAIYRRQAAQPGSFLRGLVGVLEATTQDLDASIGSMGRRVHPATAEGPWLDHVARWLDLPWDDGLAEAQKREILRRAPDLARTRGTRAGLVTLLEALLPGSPRRFRVTDFTADHGFAVLAGDGCAGGRLPALLGGRTPWALELGVRARVGASRLPCASRPDEGAWAASGRVRIEIAASRAERDAWEPWLARVVARALPVTARAEVRWVGAPALLGDRLEDGLTLQADPPPHLGTDAITGVARLPEGRSRLSGEGDGLGSRLF